MLPHQIHSLPGNPIIARSLNGDENGWNLLLTLRCPLSAIEHPDAVAFPLADVATRSFRSVYL